jgi:hypothetical protein
LLRYVDRQIENKASRGTEWLLRILSTRESSGFYCAPIWGLAVDAEVEIGAGARLVPFDHLPDTFMKGRIQHHAEGQWNNTVWQSPSCYDRPAAAIIRRMNSICYIGNPETPFAQLDVAQNDLNDQLAFLQASAAGAPLVASSWFEWENTDLDFNNFENYMNWHLPEVVPLLLPT